MCNCVSKDEQICVYSDILNELIDFHFGNLYLGRSFDSSLQARMETSDSKEVKKELVDLHNAVYNNPERFCVIYMDTILRPEISSWDFLKKRSDKFSIELCKLIGEFSPNGQEVIDSLNTIQSRYNAEDFVLCTSKIKSIVYATSTGTGCLIGKIVLSKMYLNKERSKGLLYYEFRCGWLCGHSALIVFENKNGNWRIKENFWLSVQ